MFRQGHVNAEVGEGVANSVSGVLGGDKASDMCNLHVSVSV
jgi:hypothetical protein